MTMLEVIAVDNTSIFFNPKYLVCVEQRASGFSPGVRYSTQITLEGSRCIMINENIEDFLARLGKSFDK